MKAITVEFDGAIVDSGGVWPQIGSIKPNAIQALKKIKENGFKIVITSIRNNKNIEGNEDLKLFTEMKQFIIDKNIPHDIIDDGTNGKIPSEYYIGTRNVKFTGDWTAMLYRVLYNKEMNKQDRAKEANNEDWLNAIEDLSR